MSGDHGISLHSAGIAAQDYRISKSSLQINFDGTEGYTNRSMIDVSDQIRHEEMETKDEKRVDVFLDETKGKAGVYMVTPGCLYEWVLEEIQSLDEVKDFVDSLG